MKNKIKPRHIIFSAYALIAGAAMLNFFDVIQFSWLEFAAPFIVVILAFLLYAVVVVVWANIEIKKQQRRLQKLDLDTEVSFFCHGCARPLPEPQRHLKGEQVFHKGCHPKN